MDIVFACGFMCWSWMMHTSRCSVKFHDTIYGWEPFWVTSILSIATLTVLKQAGLKLAATFLPGDKKRQGGNTGGVRESTGVRRPKRSDSPCGKKWRETSGEKGVKEREMKADRQGGVGGWGGGGWVVERRRVSNSPFSAGFAGAPVSMNFDVCALAGEACLSCQTNEIVLKRATKQEEEAEWDGSWRGGGGRGEVVGVRVLRGRSSILFP